LLNVKNLACGLMVGSKMEGKIASGCSKKCFLVFPRHIAEIIRGNKSRKTRKHIAEINLDRITGIRLQA